MVIFRERTNLDIIYANSVLLHYAVFGRMVEGEFDPQKRIAVIRQIHEKDFDTRHGPFHAGLIKAVKSKHGAHLAKRSLASVKKMKVFKINGLDAGFALHTGKGQPPFSEITSLYNASEVPNIGMPLMNAAIELGGKYLECFGEHLRKALYAGVGFEVYHSIPNVQMRNGKFKTLYFMKYRGSPVPNRNFKEMYAHDFKLFG